MTSSTSSRGLILSRIRAAVSNLPQGPSVYADLPRDYIRTGSLEPDACLALMIERLHEYGAEVAQCTPEELPATIAAQLSSSGRRTFVAPSGLPPEWLTAGFNWKLDSDLPADEIEHCDGVLTAAFAGVADSGTIVLHHSENEGRRVLSLLPDWHLCILRVSQVVETLPEYFARCSEPPALVTWIAGPSATADIEMTRIKGVHGPRFLNVILVRDDINPNPGADRPQTTQAA